MVTRKAIPKQLSVDVDFASDRTCCICRLPNRPTHIAHIDDNPANNTFENLAILCMECHALAHTKSKLSRNLTPDHVKVYNETWRQLVKERLLPQEDVRRKREYQQEVMLEITLACRKWAHTYTLHAVGMEGFLDEVSLGHLAGNSAYPYSEETWTKLHPLATKQTKRIARRMERILTLHSPVIPSYVKTLMTRCLRHLRDFSEVYSMFPMVGTMIEGLTPGADPPAINFQGIFDALMMLEDEAHKVTEATTQLSN